MALVKKKEESVSQKKKKGPGPEVKKGKAKKPQAEGKNDEKGKEITCRKTDCELFDATFTGNCLTGPVQEGECPSYMKAEGLPKVESSLMVGSVLTVPMDRELGLTDWLMTLPNSKMRLIGALIKNMLECQMDLARHPLTKKAESQESREAA